MISESKKSDSPSSLHHIIGKDSMRHTYKKAFFNDEQIAELFANSQNSMQLIHEEKGPYAYIADFLRSELSMRDPLCIQTFAIGSGYDSQWAHIDTATSVFPSITNLWFNEDDCPGESFGFLEAEDNKEVYADFFAALDRGAVADFESICTEDKFDQYTKITDYKKGDALFFDSRTVHRKLSSTPRRTLVFKYINSEDLEDLKPYDYADIPLGPDWARILIFDKLRNIHGHENRKEYLRNTARLLNSEAKVQQDPRGSAEKPAPSALHRLKRLLAS
jgi:hypothetical protein